MSLIDEIIAEAMRNGQFANLPKAGERLYLTDDPNVPAEERMARKIMADEDIAPDWVAEGKAIEDAIEKWRRSLIKAIAAREAALNAAARAATPETEKAHAAHRWMGTRADFITSAAAINRRLLAYNLKIPRVLPQRAALDAEREIRAAGG